MERQKIRVLWVSDAVAATGFARVAHGVLDELVKTDTYDIHMLGINYFGDPHDHDYNIYPASIQGGHPLGYQRLVPLVENLKPDVVFLLNDLWVVVQYLTMIPEGVPVVTYSPVDAGPLKPSWLKIIFERATIMTVYTQFARDLVMAVYPLLSPIIIPHGVDFDRFYPMDRSEARSQLENINEDDWLVLNAHRNQPRKRIDSTMRAFSEFAKDKPKNVKLYLHMGMQDAGWDLQDLWERYDIEERITITSPQLGPQNPVPDEILNFIYNTCDIGINTSLGEGWGLPNFEHAAVKRVQVVPNSSACAEIFADGRGLLVDIYDQPITGIGGVNTDGQLIKESSVVEKLQWAYEHPDECAQIADKMYNYMSQPQFKWVNIAKQFNKLLILASQQKQ